MSKNNLTKTIQIYQFDIISDWQREKRYIRREITSSVQQPIQLTDRTDTALDSGSIEILNKSITPILPFTRFQIKITIYRNDAVYKTYNNFYVVDTDSVSQVVFSAIASKRLYKHKIQLVESTKWLERFDVDNTTITNMLMFLYGDNGVAAEVVVPNVSYTGVTSGQAGLITETSFFDPSKTEYQTSARFLSLVANSADTIDCSARLLPHVDYYFGFIKSQQIATIQSFSVIRPDGVEVTLNKDTTTSYTIPAGAYGTYRFKQVYISAAFAMNYTITYTWDVTIQQLQTITTKKPSRFTIEDVVNKVLGQVTRENSVRLKGELPLFQLDESQRELLRSKLAPEFTFTQNTLFGILCEIGSAIHAMPRLIVQDANADAMDWSVITFEFFDRMHGASSGVTNGRWADTFKVAYSSEQRGENYTTAFVSNVQNAFVSNDTDYITIEEPFDDGFISTRTEEASFEISNDHAVIKTSRPIQRIIELQCAITSSGYYVVDISNFVKEKADYDLLTDYFLYNPAGDIGFGLGTKQTNIYFTRGDNVIRGLDYYAKDTTVLFTPNAGRFQTIKNILIAKIEADTGSHATAVNEVKDLLLKDLSFKIKYVPYLNFKAKQFREVIRDEMESSTLFFNQGGQQVDINAYGEHIKGALNMTSNEEPTLTVVSKTPYIVDINNNLVANLEGAGNNYIPYEISRELSKKCCVTTIRYSKDFNKWNEYIAIKKNYRQYEISERECLEQNPIYNQFVIIDDIADYDKAPDVAPGDDGYSEMQAEFIRYITSLNAKEGFIAAADRLMDEFNGLAQHNNVLKWMIINTTGTEWNATTQEYDSVSKTFLIPAVSFTMGNSALVNIGTIDNYSAGTTVEQPDASLFNDKYALERAVRYGNKYGNFEDMKVALGNGEFDHTVGDSKTQWDRAKELYKVPDASTLETYTEFQTNGFIKIWNNPLAVNKDSRQKINLTLQLNCVSAQDHIWINSDFVKRFGLSAQALNEQKLRLRYFGTVPDRFLSGEMDFIMPAEPDATVTFTKQSVTKYGHTATTPTYRTNIRNNNFTYTGYRVPVGWGLIDTNNNVILYYNKANEGRYPNNIYIEFRDKI